MNSGKKAVFLKTPEKSGILCPRGMPSKLFISQELFSQSGMEEDYVENFNPFCLIYQQLLRIQPWITISDWISHASIHSSIYLSACPFNLPSSLYLLIPVCLSYFNLIMNSFLTQTIVRGYIYFYHEMSLETRWSCSLLPHCGHLWRSVGRGPLTSPHLALCLFREAHRSSIWQD